MKGNIVSIRDVVQNYDIQLTCTRVHAWTVYDPLSWLKAGLQTGALLLYIGLLLGRRRPATITNAAPWRNGSQLLSEVPSSSEQLR